MPSQPDPHHTTDPTRPHRVTEIQSTLAQALRDRYRIERELCQGGMATVFLATDLKHPRQVAIKVLRPELGFLLGPERFNREIQVVARLNHPHILPLFDSGEADGLLFYVMPFVRGESLQARLAREKQLPIEEALRIIRQVAAALDYAHAQGMVHRDIKPDNILLHEGEAMLTDFGIAVAADAAPPERFTATGIMVGTPAYMSPEQAAGQRDLDGRSDVYSLACVLYEMLAGEPPYTGATAQAVIAKRFTEAVPPVRRLRPATPAAVEQALNKALARAPGDRFTTAGAFAAALEAAPVAARSELPSVAVLPFLNLSTDKENEFFTDGITEDVIAQLSKIRSIKVISRTSVMRFKQREQSLQEIGAALNVGAIVEGSVRRAGDRVRIVAQLIDANADQYLWSETYDREVKDIFAIQSDVSLQIVAALKAELTSEERTRIRREPTASLTAYQLCLQGRHWYLRYTAEGYKKGIDYFRQAIAADPGYAMAYVHLAMAYAEISSGEGSSGISVEEAHREALAAVTKALALDQGLGEAHSILALLKFTHDFDWVGSEREFKLALELSPGAADVYDHYSWLCSSLERYEEALTLVRRAQELDPVTHRVDLPNTLLRAGRLQEGLQEALRSVEFEPGFARGRATLGWAYILNQRPEEGLAELERAVSLLPENTLHLGQLGEAYGLTGQPAKARQVLQRFEELSRVRYVSPYHLAYVHTGLGEFDRAAELLTEAYEKRAGNVFGIKGSYLFRPLRSHPKFKALLGKLNLG
jgi:serine/threonine-protein kinase